MLITTTRIIMCLPRKIQLVRKLDSRGLFVGVVFFTLDTMHDVQHGIGYHGMPKVHKLDSAAQNQPIDNP